MIDIQIVPEEFQYDVQSMVQAFYMGHPFKINSQVQDYYRILKVVYEENRINIILSDNEKKTAVVLLTTAIYLKLIEQS